MQYYGFDNGNGQLVKKIDNVLSMYMVGLVCKYCPANVLLCVALSRYTAPDLENGLFEYISYSAPDKQPPD